MAQCMEVFYNPPGRVEAFVSIKVYVTGELAEWDVVLDRVAARRLANAANGARLVATKGNAEISWRSEADRAKCLADHAHGQRRHRWIQAQRYMEAMRRGESPTHGHVYLHPNVTGTGNLTVIDGSSSQTVTSQVTVRIAQYQLAVLNLAECGGWLVFDDPIFSAPPHVEGDGFLQNAARV